jgi:hypothetical protein
VALPSWTKLGAGASGQLLSTNGVSANPTWISGSGPLVSANSSVPAGNTIASTAAETAFNSSYTIPANSLSVGDVLRVKVYGVYSTDTIAPTIIGKVKFGSVVMLTTGTINSLVGTSSNLGWWAEAEFIVQSIGASGAIEAQGYAEFATAATTGLSVNLTNTAAKTVDTTVSQAITVTIQWGTSSAANTISLREFTVEKLNTSGGISLTNLPISALCSGRLTLSSGNPAYSPVDQTPASTDTTADTCTFTNGHGWTTGTIITPLTTVGGLTHDVAYYINASSSTVCSFHTTLANAIAGTSKVDLTANITQLLRVMGIQQKTLYLVAYGRWGNCAF